MPLKMQRLSRMSKGLVHPTAIAIESNGTIWTTDESAQVIKISSDGKRMTAVGHAPAAVCGLALSPKNEWLAVAHAKGLSRLDVETEKWKTIPAFKGVPGGLCFLPDSRLYITDRSRPERGTLLILDPDGSISDCKVGPLLDPRGLALNVYCSELFIVCRDLPGVVVCSVHDGKPGRAQTFALLPQALPEGIVMDHRANLYVGCHSPARLFKVAPDKWVSNHVEDPRRDILSEPVGLGWTGRGFDQMIVANRGGEHLTKIDMQQIGLGSINQR